MKKRGGSNASQLTGIFTGRIRGDGSIIIVRDASGSTKGLAPCILSIM